MRLIVPLPYGELTVSVHRTKRARPLFWYMVLSAAVHVLVLSLFVRFVLPTLLPRVEQQPPVVVSISSALRIERRAQPQQANQPVPQPKRRSPQVLARARATTIAQPVAEETPLPSHSPEPRRQVVKIFEKNQTTQLQRDARAFAQTAAQLSEQDRPLAGMATPSVMPASPKRYTLDIAGTDGKPQPEGILYPEKRWIEGTYVYYYVTYLVYYADGTTETGSVPWPIRFLLASDPFVRGIHRMPLPGPPVDYLLPAAVSVTPLVNNCYRHRYEYCPIERGASP